MNKTKPIGYPGFFFLGLTLVSGVFPFASEVSASAKSQATAATTREVNVFLVAVGDEGKNGKKIGCDDSLVPVRRTISATDDPLKAAIEQLLAMPEEVQDAGRQLENFWKGTSLKVKSVSNRGGTVTILITGELSVAGVCDEPRITSQIEETARQFPQVKKVSVSINGRPLAKTIRS